MQLFVIEILFFLDAVMQPIGKFVRKWCWIVIVNLLSLFINRDCVNQNDQKMSYLYLNESRNIMYILSFIN